MNDWSNPYYPPGTPVEFLDVKWNRRGLGKLITAYDRRSGEDDSPCYPGGDVHPKIKVKGRNKIILGCECWWIPVVEIKVKSDDN